MPRSRPKNRKTKYLSLRRHLAPRSSKPTAPTPPPTSPLPRSPPSPSEPPPIKPDNLFPIQQDPDVQDPQVASLLFSSTNGETGETLTEILGTNTSASASPVPDSCSAGSPGSPPVGLDTGDEDGDGLARRALRGRQRVEYCCSSSSSSSSVASACVATSGGGGGVDLWRSAPQASASASLLLKLDYEEILNAWSDRGSLYIDGEPAQIVPGFHHTAFPVWVTVGSSGEAAAAAWTAPEQGGDKADKGEVETREMRVKRYKEKRHNRLFAKKIRYEVRKLNAEKRPRLKGRFIKAMEDV